MIHNMLINISELLEKLWYFLIVGASYVMTLNLPNPAQVNFFFDLDNDISTLTQVTGSSLSEL
jgi:hypothetical protein